MGPHHRRDAGVFIYAGLQGFYPLFSSVAHWERTEIPITAMGKESAKGGCEGRGKAKYIRELL